jgi:hypothetical protein
MKKGVPILILIIIIAVSIISLSIYQFSKEIPYQTNSNVQQANSQNQGMNAINNSSSGNPGYRGGGGGGGGGGGAGAGGGGSAGGSTGQSSETSSEIMQNQSGEKFCTLSRPGSLPEIQCELLSFSQNSLKIKMFNSLDTDALLKVNIEDCSYSTETLPAKNSIDILISCTQITTPFTKDMSGSYSIYGNAGIQFTGLIGST